MAKYIIIWNSAADQIFTILKNKNFPKYIRMNKEDFEKIGNRVVSKYHFNLDIMNSTYEDSQSSGSIVARDLRTVLLDSKRIENILQTGHFNFNMDKNFILKVNKLS